MIYTHSELLDPTDCEYCVAAINCTEVLQPNHLNNAVINRSGNFASCLECGQFQIYPAGQDKFPILPREYGDHSTPHGEEVPHTRRCTKHNQRFQNKVKDLAELWDEEKYKP